MGHIRLSDLSVRLPVRCLLHVLLGSVVCGFHATAAEVSAADRAVDGLLAIYDFSESDGDLVYDRAGTRSPVHLRISRPEQVVRANGSLRTRGNIAIRSLRPPRRLIAAIKKSRSITVEAWVQTDSLEQSGPARMVTLSKDATRRNFTVGQNGDQFEVRFRTQKSNANGLPGFAGAPHSCHQELSHLVFTRQRNGKASLWVNNQRNVQAELPGDLRNWESSMHLALGDEINGSRSWRGTYYLVAIYDRALAAAEIADNFSAGSRVTIPWQTPRKRDPRSQVFELEVAGILANRCLECHDSLVRQGGLDLSEKAAAFRGGDSGPAIVPKRASESLLWSSVESDEMPHERQPLSDREKRSLKAWIDSGAVWSLQRIDPALYVHGGRPDANWLRRLTRPEYVATIQDLFGLDVSQQAETLLPQDLRADGFSNTAYNLNVDLKHIQAYQQLAEYVVSQIDVAAFCRQFEKKLALTDKGMKSLIAKMGKRILRGPLDDREVNSYHGIYTTVAATEDGRADEVAALLIEAMLQSPRFLYRVERQRGSGSGSRAWEYSGELEPVSGHELATRMSYIIWGAPPDKKLFQAAESGDLWARDAIRQQAQRMLKDPRAVRQSERFFAEWFQLERLRNLQPNPNHYPDWDPELASDMREETLAFIRDVIWRQNLPMSRLFNAQVTFATPRLAKHYQLPAEAAKVADSQGRLITYDLTEVPARGGLLTQASLLTVGGDEASMVTRGLLIMHELLRGVVKDPPPCVDTTPVPTEPGLSQRAIAEQRVGNATCGGCHGRFEPLAFGLERYDGLGVYHERDQHGNDLRADGEIIFPGAAEKVRYENAGELMELIAQSPRVQESITWKLTQFALGRPLTAADAKTVQQIHQQAKQGGGTYAATYAATLVAILESDLVTQMYPEPSGDENATRNP